MELQGNEILLFLSGQSVPIKECNIVITQPTIKQIAMAGEEEFFIAVQSIYKYKTMIAPIRNLGEGNFELNQFSDFQLFLAAVINDENLKKALNIFFDLIFPQYTLDITDGDIKFYLKKDKNKKIIGIINNFNFDIFVNIIGKLFSIHSTEKEIEYDPANDKASKIASKLKKGREKVKQIKQAEESNGGSVFGTYCSILSIGTGIDINILLNYTPFQLYDAFVRYWAKVSSDFYQKISTTPLMDASKIDRPEEWSRNLYS